MARQFTVDNNNGEKQDDNKELNYDDVVAFMDTVLCDMQSVYVLIQMLIEKNIISYGEFNKRVNDAKLKLNVDTN